MVLVSLAPNLTLGRAPGAGSALTRCATARWWCWSARPPNWLSAGRQGPADLAALIAAARVRSGALNIAVGSLGTTQHMAVESLKLRNRACGWMALS